MDTKINYTLVGFIVVLLTGFLVAALLWWSSGFEHQVYNTYMVYMDEDVTGLSDQALVKYNGVQVGYVDSMQLDLNNPQEVILYLKIKENTPITTSTFATLGSQGITGATFVSLNAKTANAPPLIAAPGQPYPVIPSEPSLLTQLGGIIKDASTNFAQVSQSIQNMLDQQNAKNFKEILANLATVTTTLANNSENLQTLITNANITFENTAKATKDLPVMMSEVRDSMRQLDTFTTNANQAVLPTLEFLNRLNQVTDNLVYVSQEMKQNPSVLIRGSTSSNLGPGE